MLYSKTQLRFYRGAYNGSRSHEVISAPAFRACVFAFDSCHPKKTGQVVFASYFP